MTTRFEEISNREILPIDVGCQTHVQLFTLKDVLRRLRDIYPNLHPRFMVQPLPHLLKALDEESVDVIIGFKEKDTRKTSASYREICQVPLVCVCSPESPLARKSQVTVQDLQEEKLVLNNPIQLPTELIHFQNDLLNGRSPWDFYFCEAPESVLTLVEAGYGISLLPSLLLPPDGRLIHLPVDGGPVFSYGLYFKDMLNNPVLKEFIHLLRQTDLSQL